MSTDSPPLQKRYLVVVWFVGTKFHGSQRQPAKRTVEGEILLTLQRMHLGQDARENNFKAGMRTDKGVHAREFAFCFTAPGPFLPRKFDAFLPPDIGLAKWAEVPLGYHPRWECRSKEYRYYLPLPKTESGVLDDTQLAHGLALLEGKHDFSLFSKADRSRPDKLTTIDLLHAGAEVEGGFLAFSFHAPAFLWEQIRRMVGALLWLARGKWTLDQFSQRLEAISSLNIQKAPRPAPVPASGLILWALDYPAAVHFEEYTRKNKYHTKFLSQSTQYHQQAAKCIEELADSVARLHQPE